MLSETPRKTKLSGAKNLLVCVNRNLKTRGARLGLEELALLVRPGPLRHTGGVAQTTELHDMGEQQSILRAWGQMAM